MSNPNGNTYVNAAVTMGTFDGVHRGHQLLIKRLRADAALSNLSSVIVTLERPVRHVPGLLTPLEEKITLLRQFGVDEILVVPVEPAIIAMPALVFFDEVIRERLHARHIVIGENFTFGHNREGTPAWLRRHCPEYRIKVDVIETRRFAGEIISSSRIRRLVIDGNVSAVHRLLGRWYSIEGCHVSGRRIGRTLGFPTVNIRPDNGKLLPVGVFAVLVESDRLLPGVLNIGSRPTFEHKGDILPELHIIDYNGQWRRHRVKVHLVARLRNEKKFEDPAALKRQIERDVAGARALLNVS